MWRREDLKSEGHLTCVQRLERRRGFRGVGKVGGCSLVGRIVVAETGARVLTKEGRRDAPTLVMVAEVGVDEEERDPRPSG